MSSDMIRELFRSLENTLHERLRIIEDILKNQVPVSGATPALEEGESFNIMQRMRHEINVVDHYATKRFAELEVRINHAELSNARLNRLEDTLNRLVAEVEKRAVKNDERPVEAVEAEVEVEATEAEALDADLDAGEIEAGAKTALAGAVKNLTLDDENEEEEEEESQLEEAEEEEEDAEEEEAVELEEFEYKGKTYYRDPAFNVYRTDDEGDLIDEVIGIWDPVRKVVRRVS